MIKKMILLVFVGVCVACDGPVDPDGDADSDSDADGDGDADSDSDADADSDADSDAEADGDMDGDCEFSWSRDGVDPFIDEVVDFSPAEGAVFGSAAFPEVVFGPPIGAGTGAGSTDVLSLGCGGSITVRFNEPHISDGPGPDFIVFENPLGSGGGVFAEPAQVSVSSDGENFEIFPCDPVTLAGCAGQEEVLSSPDNCLDPTDPAVAGGDAFDLADLGLSEATHVRLEDRSAEHSGSDVWCGGESSGFDLDAIALVLR